ncbi:electron transport protein [Bacillus sp. 31A1R]|uniref:Electron transport protein n=1 Tax=Robertmurraya mangrovi TaxID=3098077 RepID=A0ABU5ITI6_9BACI|nr:electron transport protein [Bacillus sp. 31A1R]MDZ5470482.1 electron transport protein [Bacillus sp. 31A1R]
MRRYILIGLIAGLVIVAGAWFLVQKGKLEYAFVPSNKQTVNHEQNSSQIKIMSSKEETGSDQQIELGKKLFFQETFGNEVFFTDVLGMFDGPFTLGNVAKAIIKLRGEGTNNLQVEAAKEFHLGDIQIKKGELIDTGLDVAKGSVTPLGVKVVFDEGRLKAGISCAVCHATVDNKGRVIEGVPNNDLNIGLSLAMGTNTAAYFSHTEMKNIKDYVKVVNRTVETSDGKKEALPDPDTFEQFVDSEVLKWPLGSNDTTIDFKNNPVQIPDSMTLGDQPYGWSGQGQVGPFKGLSAAINNAHAQNMDALSATEISGPVLKIDKEVYLGTALQNAANPKYRYDYRSKEKPTEFFAKVDPTPGVAGVNQLIPASTFPRASFTTTVGLFSSSPGYDTWEQLNAMSAYMNSLQPIHTGLDNNKDKYEEGRKTFINAGCISCHGGTYLSSNKVIKSEELGTEPFRGKALKGHTKFFAEPSKYADHTPVPLPENPKIEQIKLTDKEREQLNIAWAMGESNGGYKTISLFNLYWSAPYLHDGGVAVGPNMELGLTNTLMKGKKADPYNSLKAMLDSKLRRKVIDSNSKSSKLRTAHITGEGHTFWVDESTGFTKEQQDALIHYLLTVTD